MRFTGRICFLFLLAWLMLTVSVTAQKPRKLVKKAEKAFFNDNLPAALALYEKAAALKPTDPEIQYRLGYFYLLSNQTAKGITALENAVKLSSEFNPEYITTLAKQYQLSGAFGAAAAQYQLLLDKTDKEEEDEVAILKKRLQECAAGIALMAHPPVNTVRNPGAPLNSAVDDMAAVLTNNDATLVFVSQRAQAGTRQENEDIFEITRTSEGWTTPKLYGKPINTRNPDAIAYVTPDASTFYVFLEKNDGDIAEVKRQGESWTKPELLDDPINTDSFEPSFFITRDKQFAFFSSDRPDGFGGLDLYLAMRQPDGSWSEAMNLGGNINTPYDEDAPFISEDGTTLYFSSRGHNTMGGYDIFKSSSSGITWSPAENLGHPINSPADDIYFTRTTEGGLGYFTSNRNGGLGMKDIYEISFRTHLAKDSIVAEPVLARMDTVAAQPEPVAVTPPAEPISEAASQPASRTLKVYGVVTDVATRSPIAARITVNPKNAPADTATFQTSRADGKYTFSITKGQPYEVVVSSNGYFFVSETLNLPESFASDSLLRYFRLNKLRTGTKLVLKNVFFEYNNHILTESSKAELDRLYEFLEENPKMKVEISGHTDSKGKVSYNEKLSLKRAQSVIKYLAAKGINKDRLVAIGYGARRPVATNKTEAGRKMNRRTEFKVLNN